MKVLEKIENVSKFVIDQNNLYYQKSGTIFFQDIIIRNLEDNFFGEFYLNNGELIIQSNYGEFEYGGIIYKGYYNYLNTQKISFFSTDDNSMHIFEGKSQLKIYIKKQYHQFNNNAFVIDVSIIQAYTLPTAKLLWQFDLSELGEYKPLRTNTYKKYEVLKFLGVWYDQLLVACSNGLILSLDINIGQEIKRFHQCPAYTLGSDTYHHFNNAYPFVLDEKREILFALHTYYYMEIKLDLGEIIVVDLRDNMEANKISLFRQSRGYAWDDTYIYTIGEVADHKSPLALGDRCLLAFNRFSKEIEWQYIFENDSINTDIPQVSGDKLYQLSTKKVLHIFKKDD
ncbi:MAG TPA: hypothetical protein VK169_20280 [Saprospiraceae bacterium]|nr:hypothetical protein [Saprospiraceae bacterium]